ncbi:MAG TPA: choice-of-anchor D domain-containing protein [Solirubrobacterales bacterium]|nr:choice-of-anchor D domain-containing protein [Solirubrobacterales bacterium]
MNKLASLLLALFALALLPAAAAAELTFSPEPLDFGKATVGTETTAVTVTVHNAGVTGVAIDQVKIDGPDAGEFKSFGGCGWIEVGQDCTVPVSFAPGSTGAKTASLVVQPKEEPAASLSLAGTGVSPQLAFTPGSYDFGIERVNRGEGSTQLQLTNSGEAMTQLSSIGFGGKDTNNFWTNGGDCWNGRQLQPGESCNVGVGFNPWDTVAYEAELQAYVNGATFTAALSGFGGRAQLEPATMPTELGAVTVGNVGPVETILFTNHGNLPGGFFIGIVAGGDSGSFRLLDENCSLAPVLPGETCTAHVRFTPQAVGPKLARMALFGEDDGGAMALLSGEGVAPALTLAPAGFDFGELTAGERSAARAFVVRNDGKASLDLDGVALTGADPDQFLLAGDECSDSSLAPGAECLVRVRFAPDSAGAKVATLRVRGEAGGFSATLAGTGTEAGSDSAKADSAAGASAAAATHSERKRLRHRRFARGAAIAALSRGRALRPGLKARTIPR